MSPQACLLWSNIVKIEFFPFLWSGEGGAFRDVNLADNMIAGTDLLGARKQICCFSVVNSCSTF